MTTKYKIGVVGAGLVGEELVRILEQRNFPMEELRIMATSTRKQTIAGQEREVIETTRAAFQGLNIALFAGTEGESGASQVYGWSAVEDGVFVVDNGSDFRMDERVPLIIPEVNPQAMKQHQGFISNPNCSTIQMAAALAPLHFKVGIKRIVVNTYQSVSGTGRSGIRALEQQRKSYVNKNRLPDTDPYPYPILDNCLPEIGSLKNQDKYPGYFSEEIKMIEETRKILEEPEMAITATCVRVPVLMGHSEAINVELQKPLNSSEAKELWENAEGIVLLDDPANSVYPLASEANGRDNVYIGRIRQDVSQPNSLDFWCVADNIRKGAALNTVQIAEKAIEMNLI